jgi:chromosome segregation ATPase
MASTTAKGAKQNESLIDSIKNLEFAAQKVLRLSNDLKDVDRLKADVRNLQAKLDARRKEIEEKDDEIEEKEKTNQVLVEEFTKKATEWGTERVRLEKSLKVAQTDYEASSSKKLQAAQKDAQAARTKIREKERALGDAEARLIGFQEQLQACKSELDRMHDDLGIVELGDDLLVASFLSGQKLINCSPKELEDLATNLHELAKKYCGISLPDTCQPVSGFLVPRFLGLSIIGCSFCDST